MLIRTFISIIISVAVVSSTTLPDFLSDLYNANQKKLNKMDPPGCSLTEDAVTKPLPIGANLNTKRRIIHVIFHNIYAIRLCFYSKVIVLSKFSMKKIKIFSTF